MRLLVIEDEPRMAEIVKRRLEQAGFAVDAVRLCADAREALSLTAYDASNNYTVSNPIDRYALGSDDKTLKLNSDDSLTLYLQAASPGGEKESNWLPTPAGRFYVILRAYAPGERLLRAQTDPDAFPLPPIRVVE